MVVSINSILDPNSSRNGWKLNGEDTFMRFPSLLFICTQVQCDAVDQIIIEGDWMYLKD